MQPTTPHRTPVRSDSQCATTPDRRSPTRDVRDRLTPWALFCCLIFVTVNAGCASPQPNAGPDPAAQMIAQIDASPPEKRPPSWELTKARMARRPPQFGQPAPDFTLPTLDGDPITRSQCHPDKPLVLIFGSFT